MEQKHHAATPSEEEKEQEFYASKRGTLRLCRRIRWASKMRLDGGGGPEPWVVPRMVIAAIDRPRCRNAINDDVYEDLMDVMDATATDRTVGGLVLTGSGTFFTSGADLWEVVERESVAAAATATVTASSRNVPSVTTRTKMCHRPAGRFMLALLEYPKILAAAVNGPAVGIGTTLLFHCDLVYASDTATFWAPFPRLALVPEFCSSVTFPRTMGLAKANELLMLGRELDARTALEWNVCSKIVSTTGDDGDGCAAAANPFHPSSVASVMAGEIESKLLSLPHGLRTSEYFVSLIRQGREGLRKVCLEELALLDERSAAGDVGRAVRVVLDTMKAQKETKVGGFRREQHEQSRL
jgi:enoyl-CoA hydratase/carnithine racemase